MTSHQNLVEVCPVTSQPKGPSINVPNGPVDPWESWRKESSEEWSAGWPEAGRAQRSPTSLTLASVTYSTGEHHHEVVHRSDRGPPPGRRDSPRLVDGNVHGFRPSHHVETDFFGHSDWEKLPGRHAPPHRNFTDLGCPLAVASELGAPDAVITVLSLCFITPLVVGLIYLLPFPLPRLVNAHYQFCKRHNLLDKNGTPLPDDVIERYLAKYDDCDTNGQQ